ncbi:MAG: hypothetical protein ACO1RX_13525 [Candidatus Sericytochromatia bacterium]
MNQPNNHYESVLAAAREAAQNQARTSEAAHQLRNQAYEHEMMLLDRQEKGRRQRKGEL